MTYRIDLEAMSEQAWPTIPEWAKDGAAKFLDWKYSQIPTKTGAAAAVGLVLPELNGRLDGFSMRTTDVKAIPDREAEPGEIITGRRGYRKFTCKENNQ